MTDFNAGLNTETNELLKLIECPICVEMAYPPIYQCQLGHIVCCNCIPNIKECPICNQPMPDILIRNIAVEKLTENITTKQCPNSKFGCKLRLKPEDVEDHLRHCDYYSIDYCNRIGLGKLFGCFITIPKSEICNHLKDDHMLNNLIVECSKTLVVQDISNIFSTESRKWMPVILFAFNEHFFLVSEFTKQNNGAPPGITWKCIAAAPVAISEEFIAKLTLINTEKKLKLNWQGPVLSIENVDHNAAYFSIPLETLKLFNAIKYENTEKLKWTIKIAIKECSVVSSLLSHTDSFPSLNPISFTTESLDENSQSKFIFGEKEKEIKNEKDSKSLKSKSKLIGEYFYLVLLKLYLYFLFTISIPGRIRGRGQPSSDTFEVPPCDTARSSKENNIPNSSSQSPPSDKVKDGKNSMLQQIQDTGKSKPSTNSKSLGLSGRLRNTRQPRKFPERQNQSTLTEDQNTSETTTCNVDESSNIIIQNLAPLSQSPPLDIAVIEKAEKDRIRFLSHLHLIGWKPPRS